MILRKPVSAVFTFLCLCQMVGWAILAHFLALAPQVPGKKNVQGFVDRPLSKLSLQLNQGWSRDSIAVN